MTSTTIKVSTATRDRLKEQAAAAGLTLGGYLAGLADFGDRQRRLDAARRAMRSASVEEIRSYRAESAAWLDANLVDPG